MKLNKFTFALGSLLTFGSAHAAEENKKEPFVQGVNVDASVSSEYLAGKAGFIVADEPVIQTYAGIDTKIGTFHQWSNNRTSERDWSELDVGWTSRSVGNDKLGASTFVWGYAYPNSAQRFKKWDLETGFNIFTKNLPVNLNLHGTINRSGDKYSGMSSLSIGKNFDFNGTTLSLKSSVAYGHQYYTKYSGLSHSATRIEVSHPINKYFIGYAGFTAQKELNSFGGKIKDAVLGSAGLRYSFKTKSK